MHAPLTTAGTDTCHECLENSLLTFVRQDGPRLDERVGPFARWRARREAHGVWPYGRVLEGQVGSAVDVSWHAGRGTVLNFGSQDYLGLAQDPRVHEAAAAAIREHGVHSAGSPAFIGRTRPLVSLETRLADLLGKERALLFPTGWAAGYGAVAGLVRPADAIVIDGLAHNCLQEGVARSLARVTKFRHNDVDDLARALRKARADAGAGAVFLVLESLYSMDADSPDLEAVMACARQHGAVVIIDVAHDFGASGARGLGLLERVRDRDLQPDVIMGSFSKTFAANGGFVAASTAVIQYLQFYAAPVLFSNAMSPMQAAVIARCLDIVFSAEGGRLRQALAARVDQARRAFTAEGCEVAGQPSAIVPVFVGREAAARLTARYLQESRLLANLVEFPAVPRGKARFRFQIMASHAAADIADAARTFGACARRAAATIEAGVGCGVPSAG